MTGYLLDSFLTIVCPCSFAKRVDLVSPKWNYWARQNA